VAAASHHRSRQDRPFHAAIHHHRRLHHRGRAGHDVAGRRGPLQPQATALAALEALGVAPEDLALVDEASANSE
jgi:hypothetical protein